MPNRPGARSAGGKANGSTILALRAVRVGVGHDRLLPEALTREWLLIEWPEGESRTDQIYSNNAAANIGFRDLVDLAKLRWRIERDYQELKQELGLGHYEGRGWRGFHHHATLCIAAYGFLISERATIPPSGPHSAEHLQGASFTQRLSIPRLPPFALNVTFQTRSPPCAYD